MEKTDQEFNHDDRVKELLAKGYVEVLPMDDVLTEMRERSELLRKIAVIGIPLALIFGIVLGGFSGYFFGASQVKNTYMVSPDVLNNKSVLNLQQNWGDWNE